MADLNGSVVKNTSRALYKVIVGVGYTIVESKDEIHYHYLEESPV